MKKNKKGSVPKKFLIPIIILSVTFVFLFFSFISICGDNFRKYSHDAHMFYYIIDAKEYSRVYTDYCDNISASVDGPKYNDVYAIAEYWRNSFYYYGLKDYQDVSSYEQKREKAKKNMTELSYVTKDIDEMLEVYE